MVQQADLITRMSQADPDGADPSVVAEQPLADAPAAEAPDDGTTDWKAEAESLKNQLAEEQSKSKKLENDTKGRQGRQRKQAQDDTARLALEGKVDGLTTTMDAILTAMTSENTEGLQDRVDQAKQTASETQAIAQARIKYQEIVDIRDEALIGEDGSSVLDWESAEELSAARMQWGNAMQAGNFDGLHLAVREVERATRKVELDKAHNRVAEAKIEVEQQAEKATREANPAALGAVTTSGGGSESDKEFARKMDPAWNPGYSATDEDLQRARSISNRHWKGQP